jgi:hypothetical protein
MKAKLPLLSALLLTLFSGSGFAKDANSLGPISLEQTFASPPSAANDTARPRFSWSTEDPAFVSTTYGKYRDDERKHSTVGLRFKIDELNTLARNETRGAHAPCK